MTTPAAERLYEAEHEGKGWAFHNPNNVPHGELPVIYGFNNGGSRGMFHAQLVSEDGMPLGSHGCTSEAYMPSDLGILEGSRPDRHETFQEHYPDGYRMVFVSRNQVKQHKKLMQAITIATDAAKKEDAESSSD